MFSIASIESALTDLFILTVLTSLLVLAIHFPLRAITMSSPPRHSGGSAKGANHLPSPNFESAAQNTEREVSFRNLYHITFLLRHKLNPDTVRVVVSHAGFYEAYHERRRAANMVWIDQSRSPQPCLTTHPLRARARIKHPVRRVEFRIESHDQGWVSDRNAGSWTWFSASVLPASTLVHGLDRTDDNIDTDSTLSIPGPPRPAIFHNVPWPRVEDCDPEYDRNHPMFDSLVRDREIVRNVTSATSFDSHHEIWTSDAADPGQSEWVKALQRGDRIVVRAWARFNGWSNTVGSVSVSIFNAPLA